MSPEVAFIVADLERYTRGEIVRLANNIDANLRENPPGGTPVDTGWARANWVPSIGEPVYLPDQKDPSPAQITARAQKSREGANDVLSWKPADGPIFVTNNVDYIAALNAGHSPQSPPGFVQYAVEKAVRETSSRAGNQGARNRRAANAKANKKVGL